MDGLVEYGICTQLEYGREHAFGNCYDVNGQFRGSLAQHTTLFVSVRNGIWEDFRSNTLYE